MSFSAKTNETRLFEMSWVPIFGKDRAIQTCARQKLTDLLEDKELTDFFEEATG